MAEVDVTLSRRAQQATARFPLAFFVLKARSGPAINSPLFALDYGATLSDLLILLPQMWIRRPLRARGR
jgi:hypothetical protein